MKKCYCEELCTQLTTFVVEVWVLLAKNIVNTVVIFLEYTYLLFLFIFYCLNEDFYLYVVYHVSGHYFLLL